MSLRTRLNDALKDAMRSKDQRALSTIRMALAALKEADIEARTKGNAEGVGDAEIMGLVQKLVKQRRDSIALYEQGGRPELAKQEAEEITVLESFLPRQMDEQDAENAIRSLIDEIGANSIKDMGRVMAELRTRYAGQMDFGKASNQIKEQLTAKAG